MYRKGGGSEGRRTVRNVPDSSRPTPCLEHVQKGRRLEGAADGQGRSGLLKPTPEQESLGGAKRRVDQHERLTTSEPPSALPDTRMGEPQGFLLRLRRPHPHTKPQPRGRCAREAEDSRAPLADEPPVRDHSTRFVDTQAPTMSQRPEPAEARPHHSQASTEHKKPATDYETQASVPRETTHPPHTSSPAVKSKCRVSLSRGSVRFERGGPHTV